MTTLASRYTKKYEIITMLKLPPDMHVFVVTKYKEASRAVKAIALAKVIITHIDTYRKETIEEWTELRYVVLNENNEPDVSYLEDHNFVEIIEEGKC